MSGAGSSRYHRLRIRVPAAPEAATDLEDLVAAWAWERGTAGIEFQSDACGVSIVVATFEAEKLPVKGVLESGASVSSPNVSPDHRKAFDQSVEFLRDRLTHVLGERGFAYDEVAAAMGADGDSPLAFRAIAARTAALQGARQEPGFAIVAQAAKRIANITKGMEAFTFTEAFCTLEAERALCQAALALHGEILAARATRDFATGLRSVRKLAEPLEAFFKDVMVMDPDQRLKQNRIALLQSIQSEIRWLADLSQIVV